MDYLAVGRVIINNLRYLDGTSRDRVLGGSVIYAYGALRLLTDSCAFSAEVGEDFESYYGDWMRENDIPRDCLTVVDPHTMQTNLEYREDGSYKEYSVYGGTVSSHSANFDLWQEHAAEHVHKAKKGIYCFVDTDFAAEGKKEYGYRIMYEATPRVGATYGADFARNLGNADIFSVNRNEAKAFFGVSTEEECIRRLMEYEVPCFFRLGSKGSAMISGGRSWFVPSVSIGAPGPDPTGCGNASTAAAMWAWFEGYDPLMTACIANVAAAYTAAQYGPIPKFTEELRRDVFRRAENLYNELKNS